MFTKREWSIEWLIVIKSTSTCVMNPQYCIQLTSPASIVFTIEYLSSNFKNVPALELYNISGYESSIIARSQKCSTCMLLDRLRMVNRCECILYKGLTTWSIYAFADNISFVIDWWANRFFILCTDHTINNEYRITIKSTNSLFFNQF